MKNIYRSVALSLAVLCVVSITPCRAAETVIYRFTGGSDGEFPLSRLLEYQGALYGTTYEGGVDNYGTAFKLTAPANGKTAWTKTVLYSFTGYTDGYDGKYPMAGLIAGPGGAFYGTTNGGGLYGYGTAFKLVPPPDGESKWSEVVIYDFCKLSDCSDGTYPQDSLLAGPDGSLYGTTSEGGLFVNKGTVFKLTPPPGAATKWSETVLYSFCSVGAACDDGSHPVAELIADNAGALYGTTVYGGSEDSGTVFKLTPPAKGQTAWTESVLNSFCVTTVCLDGKYPQAGLVFGQQGVLYGTTYNGGLGGNGYGYSGGVVFKLTPPGNGQSGWTETVPYSFKNHLYGAHPIGTLITDSQGVLYGTTLRGGPGSKFGSGSGVVFKLAPPPQGGFKWTETVLTTFSQGSNTPSNPHAGVISYQGALYGTSVYGGQDEGSCYRLGVSTFNCGTVFKVPLGVGSSAPGGGDPSDGDGDGDDGVGGEPGGGSGGSGPPPRTDLDAIRKIVQDVSQKDGSKAVEFGMWQGDRELLKTAMGRSMTEVPAATNMHYRIGGIAETFMSTLLLMLEEQGRIDLDQKISRWFPNLLGADQVTPRMLVADTAGYIDYVTVDDFVKLELAQPFRTFTDDELIHYSVRDGKMQFAPGTSQKYSHTDNVILGQVIERATHESIAELYEKNIFKPMGMRNTYFPSNEEIPGPVLHAFTKDRGIYEDCTYWNPSWGSTPGLPISNLRDIGKWGPILGTGRLISRKHFKEQIAPWKGNKRPDVYFAYGFVVANGWIVQNPAINGYSGAFAYNMANGVTITVEATKSETATTDTAAFDILRQVVKYVTPKSPINF